MKTLTEAVAARESAEFERMVAEKEHERSKREAEMARTCRQECTEHARELAIIATNKKVAIAHAKLKAIEEENGENVKLEIVGIPKTKSEERTSTWVHSSYCRKFLRHAIQQNKALFWRESPKDKRTLFSGELAKPHAQNCVRPQTNRRTMAKICSTCIHSRLSHCLTNPTTIC